jgi:hypothetical protein
MNDLKNHDVSTMRDPSNVSVLSNSSPYKRASSQSVRCSERCSSTGFSWLLLLLRSTFQEASQVDRMQKDIRPATSIEPGAKNLYDVRHRAIVPPRKDYNMYCNSKGTNPFSEDLLGEAGCNTPVRASGRNPFSFTRNS